MCDILFGIPGDILHGIPCDMLLGIHGDMLLGIPPWDIPPGPPMLWGILPWPPGIPCDMLTIPEFIISHTVLILIRYHRIHTPLSVCTANTMGTPSNTLVMVFMNKNKQQLIMVSLKQHMPSFPLHMLVM